MWLSFCVSLHPHRPGNTSARGANCYSKWLIYMRSVFVYCWQCFCNLWLSTRSGGNCCYCFHPPTFLWAGLHLGREERKTFVLKWWRMNTGEREMCAQVIAVLLSCPVKNTCIMLPAAVTKSASFSAPTALKELQSYDNVLLSFCFHPCNYMSHHCTHIFSVKTTPVALTAWMWSKQQCFYLVTYRFQRTRARDWGSNDCAGTWVWWRWGRQRGPWPCLCPATIPRKATLTV